MADLKRLAALPGGPQLSASELVCASCNRPLAGGLTFTATGGVDDGAALFCESCRGTHLGPPCRGCGLPAPRAMLPASPFGWWSHGAPTGMPLAPWGNGV